MVDLITNTYKFSQFEISYDLDKCGPQEDDGEENDDEENDAVANNGNNHRRKQIAAAVTIPLAVSVVGVTTMPFILGTLGGKKIKKNKTKRKRKKKSKSQKRKRKI